MQACFLGDSMACRFGFIVAILAVFVGAPPAKAQSGGDVGGIWLTQAGDAKVRVSKCGGGICGVIVWLKDPINPATGKPQVDDKNPNPSLARRPMIGLPLFMGMRPSGPNRWSGQIYNADDGSTYASNVSLVGADILRVEGCMGAFCGGENWTRAGR
jgi:uncharacterized protein (DUF2147 family)